MSSAQAEMMTVIDVSPPTPLPNPSSPLPFFFLDSDIQQEWMERWAGKMELSTDLHLPAENCFIGG